MEMLKTTLCYYFPILEALREPQVVRELNHLFKFHEKIPAELHRINLTGEVAVLEWCQHPHYVIKIIDAEAFKTITYYHVRDGRFPVEEDSLELRVKVADQMRKIIQQEGLDCLHVPQKWKFSHGVVAEKLDLLSWGETEKKIKTLPIQKQKALLSQIWKLVYLTGHQDLCRNFLLMKDGRIAFYDTEPYGVTLEKVENLRPQAMRSFLSAPFFSEKLKLEVIQDFFK